MSMSSANVALTYPYVGEARPDKKKVGLPFISFSFRFSPSPHLLLDNCGRAKRKECAKKEEKQTHSLQTFFFSSLLQKEKKEIFLFFPLSKQPSNNVIISIFVVSKAQA